MQLLWYLLWYSFLGFCVEVVYARAAGSPKQDRKCHLFLPLCPVYGVGGTLIVSLPAWMDRQLPLLFLASALLATGTEYLLSVFYEKVWRVSFWSYADRPGNLHGRVCLRFSLIWGLLGVLLVRLVHPLVSAVTDDLPDYLALPALLLFFADFALTTVLLRRRGSTDVLIWYR